MASEKWQDDGDDKDMCVWLVSSFPFSPLQSQGMETCTSLQAS